MRVLMVTPSYYPIKGGAESVVRTLSINLNQVGITTDVLTFNMDRKWAPHWQARVEEIDGVTVFKIPALNWFPSAHTDRITLGINLIPGLFRKYLREYDVIHFHFGDLTFPVFSYKARKPKIAHFHGPLGFYKRYFLARVILKNTADLYIAISQKMRQELVELRVQSTKIRYLPNAVDTDIFHPSGNKDENLILFVGRVTFGKGLHVLLESLKHIKTKTHLVIIGPPDYDLEYFLKVQDMIKAENRKGFHKITYVGAQEETDIIKWYQKASLLVLPSFREASSMVSLEASSCGTPVVATNVGGVSEVVYDGENGILVPPTNALRLTKAIQYFLDNEDERTRFGIRARNLAVKRFSCHLAIRNLCEIYKELS